MFLYRNKKNIVYPCKAQFNYIKVGFKGVKIIQACFRDASGVVLISLWKTELAAVYVFVRPLSWFVALPFSIVCYTSILFEIPMT